MTSGKHSAESWTWRNTHIAGKLSFGSQQASRSTRVLGATSLSGGLWTFQGSLWVAPDLSLRCRAQTMLVSAIVLGKAAPHTWQNPHLARVTTPALRLKPYAFTF